MAQTLGNIITRKNEIETKLQDPKISKSDKIVLENELSVCNSDINFMRQFEQEIIVQIADNKSILTLKKFQSENFGYSGNGQFFANGLISCKGMINLVMQTAYTRSNSEKYQEKVYKPEFLKNPSKK